MTAAARLNLASLDRVPAPARPPFDPRELEIGIVHLGPGAFHRAHQAVFTHDAVAEAGGDWGICGVTQISPRTIERLAPQDGLYSVAAWEGSEAQLRVIGSLRELLWARGDAQAVRDRLAAASTRVVTMTVTEKGYHRGASGGLDLADADVCADLADGGTRTAIAQLVDGLERRRAAGTGPVSIVSCDNLSGNGAILRALVLEFAARSRGADALAAWIESTVSFPATMVDRMVPAPTDADRVAAGSLLGLSDAGALITEPFSQWVIEDRFAGSRPAWERAGVTLADDVAPYERVKLRMLNGSHSTLAYLGALAGCELISDAMAGNRPFAAVAEAFMREDVAPTLDAPAQMAPDEYGAQVLRRFANPSLPYRTLQVAADGSQKLPQRLLAVARERRAAGAEPRWAALAVAAWMRFVSARRTDAGHELALQDPLGDQIAETLGGAEEPSQIVGRLLGIDAIFGPDLGADGLWRELLIEQLARLAADGAQAAVRGLLA